MTVPEAADRDAAPAESAVPAGPTADASTGVDDLAGERAPEVVETEMEVGIVRSVRYGRVLIGAAVLGVLVAVIVSVSFPVVPEGHYTLGQITGFMAVLGGVIGLGVGALVALVLNLVARRQTGGGVAVQADVR